MNKDDKIRKLEEEVNTLQEKEKKLRHDLGLYKKIFDELKKQMEDMKKDLKK
ncbi:MAG: hypothetical protein ACOCQG_00610 [Candidatus Nanoarchaeia archaeon]